MKIVKLECPSCGGNITDSIPEGMKYMFCKFCGQKMFIDDGVKRSEHREIKENATETTKVKAEKEIELKKLEYKERDDKRSLVFAMILLGILILMMVVPILCMSLHPIISKSQGKISAGYASSYRGKDVSVVTGSLRDLGFNNITSYDLNDAGWLWNKENTVSEISIDGKTSFSSSDYFDPNATITIYYH